MILRIKHFVVLINFFRLNFFRIVFLFIISQRFSLLLVLFFFYFGETFYPIRNLYVLRCVFINVQIKFTWFAYKTAFSSLNLRSWSRTQKLLLPRFWNNQSRFWSRK